MHDSHSTVKIRLFSRLAIAAIAIWLVAIPATGQETNAVRTLVELQKKLGGFLAQPRFDGALWGVKIVSLDTGKTLFESHADRLMSPASNSKLYTGALALDTLGGDYLIPTPVFATSKVNRFGTIHGDLIVVGHGDPTWNSQRLGTNFWDIFEPFISVLTNAGVRRIKGDIVADATFFRGPPTGASWTVDDLQDYYGAQISAFAVEDNYTQVAVEPGASSGAPCKLKLLQPGTGIILSNQISTVESNGIRHIETYRPPGTRIVYVSGRLPLGDIGEVLDVPVPQPAEWFASGLKEALTRRGIKVSGKARCIVWPQTADWNSEGAIKLGEVFSPPLREVVRGFMKPSQNLQVDMLLAHVGEMTRTSNAPPWQTSEELGISALHKFLGDAGLPSSEVHFDEGSGLSRNNLTTANATVALLQYMATNHASDDFINSLPIAGVDGTLRRRMKNTPAAGNLRAKTGTLRWANSLSGYVASAAGERLAFSLMLNRYVASGAGGRADLDVIAEAIAGFQGRSDDASPLAETFAPFGQLIVTQLASAPFPHLARTDGHTYHDKFYSAKEHYSDSTVAIFIPKNFRETNRIDFVIHFHGWNNSVRGTLEQFDLIEQMVESGKNAVLVVPEGPLNAPDSFGGKLEDTNGFSVFMNEVADTLKSSGKLARTNFDIGNIILSGHSGGYHVMSAILNRGGLPDKIKEAWLFDALYGGTENFVSWQKNENGRLLDIYTDHGGTKEETENLMASLKTNGVRFYADEDSAATADDLRTSKLIFLHTDMVHNDVVAKRRTFELFLSSSCLDDR